MDQFGAHTKAADNNQAALRRAAVVQAALTQPPQQPATLVDEVLPLSDTRRFHIICLRSWGCSNLFMIHSMLAAGPTRSMECSRAQCTRVIPAKTGQLAQVVELVWLTGGFLDGQLPDGMWDALEQIIRHRSCK